MPTNTGNVKPATDPLAQTPIFLQQPPVVSSVDVDTIQLNENMDVDPGLLVVLKPTGAKKLSLANATGGKLAVLINGKVILVPKVLTPISDSMFVSFPSKDEAEQYFSSLTSQ